MIYLSWYLGIGVVVLVVVYAAHRLDGRGALYPKLELLDALRPERKTWRYRILSGIVAPALTAIVVVVGWPVAIGLKLKSVLALQLREAANESEGFVVHETDLERSFTLAEIEDRERVVDPLRAVPDLPFGHLNPAWRRFVDLQASGDTAWSFSTRRKSALGREEWCRGYVWVRSWSRGPVFVTARRLAGLSI